MQGFSALEPARPPPIPGVAVIVREPRPAMTTGTTEVVTTEVAGRSIGTTGTLMRAAEIINRSTGMGNRSRRCSPATVADGVSGSSISGFRCKPDGRRGAGHRTQ